MKLMPKVRKQASIERVAVKTGEDVNFVTFDLASTIRSPLFTAMADDPFTAYLRPGQYLSGQDHLVCVPFI